MAILKVIKGLNPGQIFELTGPEFMLGRHPTCEIVLSNSEVSRFHARLLHQADGYYLEDLNSRNGTYVNEQRVEVRQRLSDGDQIALSDVEVVFLLGDPDRMAETLAPSKPPEATTSLKVSDKPVSSSTVISILDAVTSPGQRIELNSASKLRAVLEITQSLGTSLAVDEVLPKILDSIFNLFPQAYRGYILLSEEPGPHLRPCVVKVRNDEPGSSITISPISHTIARRVMTEAKALLITDAVNDERFEESQSVIDLVLRCVMCAPLLGPSGKPLGIIHIDTQDAGQMFDEDDLDVLLSAAILAGQAVEYARMHSALLELDRHKRESEELQHAKNAAEQANRAKSEFLANISHELRTPLNAVLGMTELTLSEELTPTARDYLLTSQDSAQMLLGLLNEILDFSRLESGKFALEVAPFSLRSTLEDTVRTLAVRASKKGLELACEVPPGVPDWFVGDSFRLRQILTNLVGNAIKFTEQGEVVIRASVETELAEEMCLLFEVRDTGIGIPAADQKRIFAPFTQADASTTRRYGGTGLGLAIASNLIGLMGGRLWVESQLGRGSTFSFTARFSQHLDATDFPEGTAPILDALSGMPVLLVDDNTSVRRIVAGMLTGWSMQPELAADGATALARIQEAAAAGEPFPLVIVDSLMPGTDGFSVAEQIVRNPQTACPVILMLSLADRQTFAKRHEHLQTVAFLEKPISQAELLQVLGQALGLVPVPEPAPPAAGSTGSPPPTGTLRILLAEDTAANRKFIIKILEKRGHEVEIAHNGREATDLARQQQFDVVLMDVQMPIMDGFQATAAIRAQQIPGQPPLPIIALTAHAMRGDQERCLSAGMSAYIAKPIDSRKLIELVESLAQAPRSETKGD